MFFKEDEFFYSRFEDTFPFGFSIKIPLNKFSFRVKTAIICVFRTTLEVYFNSGYAFNTLTKIL